MDTGVLNISDGNAPQTENYYSGVFTRDLSLATGTQVITGLGFQPKTIHFLANVGSNAAYSTGFTDGTTEASIANNHNQTANTFANRAFAMFISMGSGNEYQGEVSAIGTDGFTVSWTKYASPTGTVTVRFLAFK
jgi:hypothetical protein